MDNLPLVTTDREEHRMSGGFDRIIKTEPQDKEEQQLHFPEPHFNKTDLLYDSVLSNTLQVFALGVLLFVICSILLVFGTAAVKCEPSSPEPEYEPEPYDPAAVYAQVPDTEEFPTYTPTPTNIRSDGDYQPEFHSKFTVGDGECEEPYPLAPCETPIKTEVPDYEEVDDDDFMDDTLHINTSDVEDDVHDEEALDEEDIASGEEDESMLIDDSMDVKHSSLLDYNQNAAFASVKAEAGSPTFAVPKIPIEKSFLYDQIDVPFGPALIETLEQKVKESAELRLKSVVKDPDDRKKGLTGIGEVLLLLNDESSQSKSPPKTTGGREQKHIVLDFGGKVQPAPAQEETSDESSAIEKSRLRESGFPQGMRVPVWAPLPDQLRKELGLEEGGSTSSAAVMDKVGRKYAELLNEINEIPPAPDHPKDFAAVRKLVRKSMPRCKVCKNRFGERILLELHLKEAHPHHYLKHLLEQEREAMEQKEQELQQNRLEEIFSGGFIPPEADYMAENVEHAVAEIPLPGELSMNGRPAYITDRWGTICQPKPKFKKKVSPQCSLCDKRFRNEISLKKHIFKKHPEVTELIQCRQCFKILCSKDELMSHDCDISYLCFECSPIRNLCTPIRLANHRAKFHRGKASGFKCAECGMKFLTPRKLRKHKKMSHVFTKTYACHFCEELFTNEVGVMTHERIHTGIIKFECQICDYRCNRFIEMDKHKRDEHGYLCSICQVKFADWPEMKNHTLMEHGGYLTEETGHIESPRVWLLFKGE